MMTLAKILRLSMVLLLLNAFERIGHILNVDVVGLIIFHDYKSDSRYYIQNKQFTSRWRNNSRGNIVTT